MNLGELQAEVQARGFDYLSATRLNYFLNRAYHRFCEREAWPFLEDTETGTSPLTIADLRAVLSVVDSTNGYALSFEDIRTIRQDDPAITSTGSPYCWYQSAPTVISTYPTTSVSLNVRYLKVPEDLASSADTPIIPARYHYALVDLACAYGYRDSDNPEMAETCRVAFDEAVLEASDTLNMVNYDDARSMVITGSTDW